MGSTKVAYNRKTKRQDLSKVEFETSEDVRITPTFDAMGLKDDLLRGIYNYGMYKYQIILVNLKSVCEFFVDLSRLNASSTFF